MCRVRRAAAYHRLQPRARPGLAFLDLDLPLQHQDEHLPHAGPGVRAVPLVEIQPLQRERIRSRWRAEAWRVLAKEDNYQGAVEDGGPRAKYAQPFGVYLARIDPPVTLRRIRVFIESPGAVRLHEIEADYIILGHTHYHMAVTVGRALVINPGSCGEARDHRNGFRLSCAVLDTKTGEVTFEHFDDPIRPGLHPETGPRSSARAAARSGGRTHSDRSDR